ncbi:hypothetical protein A3A79_01875 [Candidatus Gottesmanbacteria bacterium RIFCSPLOWO2_01_FULL_43_11b]|uniref:Nucleotidyl transferase AbiEii/AbiGii toxin family protein n=1 Tax=Candidatus Gottesmanbacteria bacterium RIFCSPLOWO2_01_FULL_43_11b TaxID=1798392 RepID=A0A1F6AGQ7_9BACT|nr:MAG: hypothetical protein A3A79_01875 [Candidatus Gottesmanbacteria bacterium RIFCSPLOWO2_01_FULL_43_11b]
MILPYPKDALHKAMLYRLLIGLLDAKDVAREIFFKGGTCAAMLEWLDRFSIDLDFDLSRNADRPKLKRLLKRIFNANGFRVAEEAKNELYFILKYQAPPGTRNNLKLSIIDLPVRANVYQPQYLSDIARFAVCQTVETMFANKLIAVTDRFKKYHTIAGRDIYDIHYFFTQGYGYNQEVITERTGVSPAVYLRELSEFIRQKITERIISEDLSYLLPPTKFQVARRTLKSEVLIFLQSAKSHAPLIQQA